MGVTSGIRPKLLRMRLRPVNDLEIAFIARLDTLLRANRLLMARSVGCAAGASPAATSEGPSRQSPCHRSGTQKRESGRKSFDFRPVPGLSGLWHIAQPPRSIRGGRLCLCSLSLLDLDRGALILKHLADLGGLVLVHAFLHRLGRSLDQVL